MNLCPWNSIEPATLSFCEAVQCSWIAQPANTLSSLAYVLIGCLVWKQTPHDRTLKWFGIMAILVGITSVFYHASMSLIGEVLDIGSMFLFSTLLLTLNMRRLDFLNSKNWLFFYLPLNLISVVLLIILKSLGIYVFGTQVVISILMEFGLMQRRRRRGEKKVEFRNYWTAFTLFGLSYAIWLSDFHRIFCYPDNHFIQGHAAWHCWNSLCFYFLFRFYRQFRFD